jgi:hypothetical protein
MSTPIDPADARRALALLRVRANRALDPLFADLAGLVDGILGRYWRFGPDGIPRLDRFGAGLAFAELAAELERHRFAIVSAIGQAIGAAYRLAVAQAARLGTAAVAGAGDLAASFARILGLVGGAIGRVLGQPARVLAGAVEGGLDAREVATRLRRFFDPRFAPYRLATGRLVRADVPGALTDWPAASGMGSAPFRLIANHELTQAHRRTTSAIAARMGAHERWLLGPGHRGFDVCDTYARADGGFGPGVYRAGGAPPAPHPGCGCSLAVVLP